MAKTVKVPVKEKRTYTKRVNKTVDLDQSAKNLLQDVNNATVVKHTLKCDPVFFKRIADETKTAEIRYNDRDFQAGDKIKLVEYDRVTKEYTGNELYVRITHIFTPQGKEVDPQEFGIKPGYVMLSIKLV